ncbi:hypothetical protein LIER_34831 [Lithospermum erythrorhizon]|uniref:Uncharacterized protein n=1 Tax=Lithospermum erythrorhizon TaxID=34254 RepID=A0AAV3S0S9_LITER
MKSEAKKGGSRPIAPSETSAPESSESVRMAPIVLQLNEGRLLTPSASPPPPLPFGPPEGQQTCPPLPPPPIVRRWSTVGALGKPRTAGRLTLSRSPAGGIPGNSIEPWQLPNGLLHHPCQPRIP